MATIKNLFFILLVSLASVPALAQKVCLKASMLHTLASTLKLDLEASASPRTSLTLSPSYTNTLFGDGVKGMGVEAGLRHYFNKDSLRMRGHYLHGTFQYGHYKTIWTEIKSDPISWSGSWPEPYSVTYKETIDQIGFDVVWGYQFILQKHICIDLYAGIGIRNGGSARIDLIPGVSPGYNGPIFKSGAKIGFAF